MGKLILGLAAFTMCVWSQVREAQPIEVVAHISNIDARDFVTVTGAQSFASYLLERAGVRLLWNKRCSTCEVINIRMDADAPPELPREALAYALPFAKGPGQRIRIFRERLPNLQWVQPHIMLAYVIAHEIVHVLEGFDHHSTRGVMKARWEYADYLEMQACRFAFATEELGWVRRGNIAAKSGE
jgi:hypothetical protein